MKQSAARTTKNPFSFLLFICVFCFSLYTHAQRAPCQNIKDPKNTIQINEKNPGHKLWGFGASLTDSSVYHLEQMTPTQRKNVFQHLFSKEVGMGLDILRIPVGSSDFTRPEKGYYTYNDTPNNATDESFKYFSFDKDKSLIQYLKEIKKSYPHVKLFLTPWSAPAWMKLNKDLTGQSSPNKLDPQFYKAFSEYLFKVAKFYESQGIPAFGITLQNEPAFDSARYPSMGMSAQEQGLLIRDFVGPKLLLLKNKIQIYALDHNWDMEWYIDDLMKVSGVSNYLSGIAFHCYGGNIDVMAKIRRKYPHLEVIQTECTGWGPVQAWDFGWWLHHQVIESTKLGSSASLAWNLILDEKGGPYNGAYCTDCRGLLEANSISRVAITNPETQALGLASRLIDSNTRYVQSWGEDPEIQHLIIQQGTKKLGAVIMNYSKTDREIQIIDQQCKTAFLKSPTLTGTRFLFEMR